MEPGLCGSGEDRVKAEDWLRRSLEDLKFVDNGESLSEDKLNIFLPQIESCFSLLSLLPVHA